jgi:hypothetical protein
MKQYTRPKSLIPWEGDAFWEGLSPWPPEWQYLKWKETNDTHMVTEAFRCPVCEATSVLGIAEALKATRSFEEFMQEALRCVKRHQDAHRQQRTPVSHVLSA